MTNRAELTNDERARESDVALIVRIGREDKAAFTAFYDQHSAQAYGLALRILSDRAASDDVTQEAFWRVWQHARRFNVNGGNPRAWLLTIVHRLSIDYIRKGRHNAFELDADTDDSQIDLVDQAQDVFEHTAVSISSHQVRKALWALEANVRQILELSYFHGLTHRQIAERLNQPLGTVHGRVLQGMSSLKKALLPLQGE